MKILRVDSGSASVEAAVTVVWMLLVGVLIVETGNYWYANLIAQEAASIGARVAAQDGRSAGEAAAESMLRSSNCISSGDATIAASDGDNRSSRYRVTVTGTVRPRLSPWPRWASGLRSIAYSSVSGTAASVREGD